MPERNYGGSRLLRLGRSSLAGHVYMLTACTENRRPIFRDLFSARLLVREFQRAEVDGLVRSIAYVVMPDHFHWMVRLGSVSDLSSLVQQVKGRSAFGINRMKGVSRRVWQDGFHDRAVRRGQDLRALARYIVANPLRAGLVEDIGDWPHWDAVWVEGGGDDSPLEP